MKFMATFSASLCAPTPASQLMHLATAKLYPIFSIFFLIVSIWLSYPPQKYLSILGYCSTVCGSGCESSWMLSRYTIAVGVLYYSFEKEHYLQPVQNT